MASDGWEMTVNLLAFETSGRSGSVAILQASRRSLEGLESGVIVSEELDPRWGSAKTLAPCVERMLSKQGLFPKDLDAIAVVQGPGSFTGLRVGIATAKVMAYALNIPVIAVDTLEVLAHQIYESSSRETQARELITVVDAFRGQCFWARYRLESTECHRVIPTRIDDNSCLAEQILRDSRLQGVTIAGPSSQKVRESYRQILQESSGFSSEPDRVVWLDCIPQAATVARLGFAGFVSGDESDVFGLLPTYYRSSAAEEKQSAAQS